MRTYFGSGKNVTVKALFVLLLAALLATQSLAQSPRPETLGPGWHLGSADAVSPESARRALAQRIVTPSRQVEGILASETEATPEIIALARALENDPKLIFDYIHNHIEYIPTFGSVNGATATLLAGRGNDWDQASLFIALMRTAGYTANYARGDVTYSTERLANWLGVGNASVGSTLAYGGIPATSLAGGFRITRAWAEAEINGQTYIFDPAMKEYSVVAGIDLNNASGYNRDTFMTRAQEGAIVASDLVQYMNEDNIQADLTTYGMNLVNYIRTTMPDATLAEIIGGREIVMAEMSVYPTALPYALDVINETTFTTIPDSYRHTLRVQHAGIDHTFRIYEIAGGRLSIFYDAADDYRPVLRVDGTTIATGNPTNPGGLYDLTLSVDHPYAANGGTYADQSGEMQLVSGSDYVIVHDFNAASSDLIAKRNKLLTQYIHDGYADDSEPVRGEGLWLMGLAYSLEDHLFAGLLGQIGEGVFIQHHLAGLMGQDEGYLIDLPLSITSFAPSGGASAITAHRAYAMMGSALEHGMLEQMQGSEREALSSIKVLQLNNQVGNMTFLADADNWGWVEPNLQNYWPEDLDFIENYIYDGYTFVLPEYGDINLNQWYGSGYIGYKDLSMGMWIGGGYAGGMVSWMLEILLDAILATLKEQLADPDGVIEIVLPESKDPVDMVTGGFHYRRQDLAAGPSGLLELTFDRSYNSNSNDNLGPLGYGWGHNHEVSLIHHHDYEAGLGGRQPTDAAALIAYAYVVLDLLEKEDNIQGWMSVELATKWAMDQLIDNAVTVHLGSTTMEYTLLADSTYNPPPGIRQSLVENGDTYYAQGEGNTSVIFDADGRGRFWLDANGNSLTYTYDGDGVLQSVGNLTLGQSLTFAYTADRLSSVTDQAGRSVTFEYTDDELTTFRDAEGHAYHYDYDSAHRLTAVTYPRGNTVVTNVYDEMGRVETQSDALGNTTIFYFGGFRNWEQYADGGRQVYYVDAFGRTIAREDAIGNRVQMTYDGQYHLRTQTDRQGSLTSYAYDPESGSISTVTNHNGDDLTYTYTAQEHTFTNPSNSDTFTFIAHYLTRIAYPDGSHMAFSYDSKGNRTSRADQAGKTWSYQYNNRGQITRITNPAGGQTDFTFNADGTLASSTDSGTGVTTYGYDTYLRQNRITYPGGSSVQTVFNLNDRITSLTDERGYTTIYDYDANDNLVTETDPLGQACTERSECATTYTYDSMDQLIARTNRRGKVTTFAYDNMNRLAAITDPNGNTTRYGYDQRGWQTQVTDPAGQVFQTGYNDEGLKTASISPLGHTTTYDYDSLGRLAWATDPLGNDTNFSRDALGRVVTSTDPMGRTTRYAYEARGLTAAITLPDGGITSYVYNDLGLLASLSDLQGSAWDFAYTTMGQIASFTDPLSNQWSFTYDQRGWVVQVTYPGGETENRTYDASGNLIRQQYSAGPDLNYTFDELERMIAANGISLTYNAVNQVVATTDQASGFVFGAGYDDGGRLETVSYVDGADTASAVAVSAFTVTYQYDSRNLLTRVSDDLTGVSVEFTYDDDGRLIGVQRSNGVDATFTWDAASRLTRIQEGALIDLQYTYNAAGEVAQAVMSTPLDPGDYLVTGTVGYSYDAASQISSPGFVYDARGRLTADPQHTYAWDGASRLVGVGQDVILSYNGLGDLLTRSEGGRTTGYFYNYALGLTPIVAEQDADTGQFQRFYVWTPDGRLLYMISLQDGERVYFYHFDRSGSTLALTDQAGTLTDAYAYEPYGRLLHHQGSNAQPFTYLGQWGVRQEGDADTEHPSGTLYQMRARYYDAVTGRFISRELLWPRVSRPQAVNPYQYALQDPLNHLDRTGTDEEDSGSVLTDIEYGAFSLGNVAKYGYNIGKTVVKKVGFVGYIVSGAIGYYETGKYIFSSSSARHEQLAEMEKTLWGSISAYLGSEFGEWWYGLDYIGAQIRLEEQAERARQEAEEKAFKEKVEADREWWDQYYKWSSESQAYAPAWWALDRWLNQWGLELKFKHAGEWPSYKKAWQNIFQGLLPAGSQ